MTDPISWRAETRAEVEVLDRAPIAREVRDPSAATRSLRYITPGRATPPDWNATKAFEVAYYSSTAVWACVRVFAKTISGLEFRVGADPRKPNDYDPNAPLARLLGPPPGGPSPKTAARRLWAWTAEQRIVTGRNGWEIELGDDGKPVALWPLPAPYLDPIPTTSGNEYWSAFEFGRATDKRRLPADRVLYDWDWRGTDVRQAQTGLEAAALAISVDVMQARYDYAFLKNDARPPVIIVTEEFEDADSYQAFKDQWNSSYGGPNNAGRAAFLEADVGTNVGNAVDVKVIGVSPKDAQSAQRAEAVQQRIANALGVPWSLIDASGRTFDNASQEWQNWCRLSLVPLLADFADMVNMQLAPRFGSNVGWFDLAPLGIERKRDPVTAQVGAPAMVQSQIMTINEARADYGLEPVKDGDRFMTAEEIAALRGGVPVDGGATRSVEVREVPAPDAALLVKAVEPPAPLAPEMPEDRGETAEEAEARRTKVWKTTDAAVRNLERAWEKAFQRLFARQAKSVLGRLEHKRARRAISEVRALTDEVFDPEHWIAETLDEARVLYERVADSAGGKMGDRFGIAFDLDAPYVQEFVQARAKQLAGDVTDTTYQAIKDALAEGVEEGESIPDLAERVRHVFDVASQSRATTIARTEVISAYNGAATSVASSYGDDVVAGQEWIATRDARTREAHAERDGERVPVGETFSGGLAYPGDPSGDPAEVVNCRCTVAFLTPDEFNERSIPVGVARTLIALVRPGQWDERAMRSVMRAAA